jgi:endonuclease YncB( thermonuclease family)
MFGMGLLRRIAAAVTLVVVGCIMAASTSIAADRCGIATVIDGGSIKLEGGRFRLDGIDAPETDQQCLEASGAKWNCGIEARDQLGAFINGRSVCCTDKGPDQTYRSRRMGRCKIGNESLNRWLVSQGLALDFKPYSGGRFRTYQQAALLDQRGLWRGCFVAPWEFRRWNRSTAQLLGAGCPGDASQIRDQLFPVDSDAAPGCPAAIKGKIRPVWTRLFKRYRGTYYTEGCGDYPKIKIDRRKGDRWFCGEEEALAQDFRKAQNCK